PQPRLSAAGEGGSTVSERSAQAENSGKAEFFAKTTQPIVFKWILSELVLRKAERSASRCHVQIAALRLIHSFTHICPKVKQGKLPESPAPAVESLASESVRGLCRGTNRPQSSFMVA
ncbi:hypothetical protein, partial [Marivita sp. GX14005]|uniref:hypothetical protein n=1 Tax=Marivita sp. GX14005 TaxID=2942276 RepID=UPI00201A1B47